MRYLKSVIDAMDQCAEVKRRHGVPFARQFVDLVGLKLRGGGVGIQDYFDHRLFEQGAEADARRRTVAGWRFQESLDVRLNHRRWKCLVDDKIVAYLLLASARVPTPRLTAVFNRHGGTLDGVPCFRQPEALADFLRRDAAYPCFAKPIRGSVGGGGAAIVQYDAAGDQLLLSNGTRSTVTSFVEEIERSGPGKIAHAGYLFQDLVEQHPAMCAVVGPTVSTARVVLLVGDEEVTPLTAIWRVARRGNMTDNFNKGRSGNLIAALDMREGEVVRVANGYGVTQTLVDVHPDTGCRLLGFRLPDWAQALDMCRSAAPSFPNLRFQHWDVAFSRTGPVVLEVNAMGSVDMLQYASGVGLLDERLEGFLERYG